MTWATRRRLSARPPRLQRSRTRLPLRTLPAGTRSARRQPPSAWSADSPSTIETDKRSHGGMLPSEPPAISQPPKNVTLDAATATARRRKPRAAETTSTIATAAAPLFVFVKSANPATPPPTVGNHATPVSNAIAASTTSIISRVSGKAIGNPTAKYESNTQRSAQTHQRSARQRDTKAPANTPL